MPPGTSGLCSMHEKWCGSQKLLLSHLLFINLSHPASNIMGVTVKVIEVNIFVHPLGALFGMFETIF